MRGSFSYKINTTPNIGEYLGSYVKMSDNWMVDAYSDFIFKMPLEEGSDGIQYYNS